MVTYARLRYIYIQMYIQKNNIHNCLVIGLWKSSHWKVMWSETLPWKTQSIGVFIYFGHFLVFSNIYLHVLVISGIVSGSSDIDKNNRAWPHFLKNTIFIQSCYNKYIIEDNIKCDVETYLRNVIENQRGNHEWRKQRNWQHWVHKTTSKQTNTTQHNICWTPLHRNKHK